MADDTRTKIVGVINKPIQINRYLSPVEEKALKALLLDRSIVILQADKGQSTVIMDLEDYDGKMLSMVKNNNTYNCIKKDPSSALQSRMNSLLLTLMKKKEISQNLYQRICRSDGITPQIYGLPNIHKPDVLLRPIVSFYSSPTYYLSKHLCHQSLQFSSHHPTSHKQSVARTLFTRASTHSSSLIQRAEEEIHIMKVLCNNSYPNKFIKDCHKKVQQKSLSHLCCLILASLTMPL